MPVQPLPMYLDSTDAWGQIILGCAGLSCALQDIWLPPLDANSTSLVVKVKISADIAMYLLGGKISPGTLGWDWCYSIHL